MAKKQVLILGAGITGLVAGYYLSQNPDYQVTVVEKEKTIGGTAFGFEYKDFTLDFGPHKLYTELPGIIDEIKKVSILLKIKKTNSIFLKNNIYDFPLKITQVATKMPLTAIKAGVDILTKSFSKKPDNSYENFLLNRFGKTMYDLSFKDYAQKVWTSKPTELDKELAIKRVAISNIFELIKGILFKDTKNISAEYFYYPPKGIKQLLDNLADKIKNNKGKVLLKTEVSEIKIKNNKIESAKLGKKKIKPDYIISTIYLDSILKTIKDTKNTPSLQSHADSLKYQGVNVLYLVLNKQKALKDCWMFFPEKKFMFHRISEQKSFSPFMGPKNKTVLMVETTQPTTKENINKIISQLASINIINPKDIEETFVKSSTRTYPIYKKGFQQHMNPVIQYLESIDNFYTIGRPGLFNYNNMDQCWDMAKKTSEHIQQGRSKQDWQNTKKYFNSYRIVD